jgi:hypothetical protein
MVIHGEDEDEDEDEERSYPYRTPPKRAGRSQAAIDRSFTYALVLSCVACWCIGAAFGAGYWRDGPVEVNPGACIEAVWSVRKWAPLAACTHPDHELELMYSTETQGGFGEGIKTTTELAGVMCKCPGRSRAKPDAGAPE